MEEAGANVPREGLWSRFETAQCYALPWEVSHRPVKGRSGGSALEGAGVNVLWKGLWGRISGGRRYALPWEVSHRPVEGRSSGSAFGVKGRAQE